MLARKFNSLGRIRWPLPCRARNATRFPSRVPRTNASEGVPNGVPMESSDRSAIPSISYNPLPPMTPILTCSIEPLFLRIDNDQGQMKNDKLHDCKFHPIHHEDTKTRRIAKDFFVSSCLRGEIFWVAAALLCVHLCSSVVFILWSSTARARRALRPYWTGE